MVIKRGSNENRHYILPVCNMACLNLGKFLWYLLRQKRLFLGHSVELRSPMRKFLIKKKMFLIVYIHIFEIYTVKYLNIKKIEYQAF